MQKATQTLGGLNIALKASISPADEARAKGIAERGRIRGTAVQAFKCAAEGDARSLYGVSWFGSCCGDAIQNHMYIGWQGHYFIFFSS